MGYLFVWDNRSALYPVGSIYFILSFTVVCWTGHIYGLTGFWGRVGFSSALPSNG